MQNTYDLADRATPTASLLNATGDPVAIGSAIGTAPTAVCLTTAGFQGRGLRCTAAASTSQSHSFTMPASMTASSRIYLRINAAGGQLPVTAAHTVFRWRSATANVLKLIVETTGICRVQTGAGAGIGSFNGGAALPDGWYCAEVYATVGTTTTGRVTARLTKVATGLQVGTPISVINSNLGTAGVTTMSWFKSETGAGLPNGFDVDVPAFNAAAAYIGPYAPPPNTPPVATITSGTPTTAMQNDRVPLRGTATDRDGTVKAAWTITSFPATLSAAPTITSPTSLTAASFTSVAPGAYTIRLTATDDDGATHVAVKTVTLSLATSSNRAIWTGNAWVKV